VAKKKNKKLRKGNENGNDREIRHAWELLISGPVPGGGTQRNRKPKSLQVWGGCREPSSLPGGWGTPSKVKGEGRDQPRTVVKTDNSCCSKSGVHGWSYGGGKKKPNPGEATRREKEKKGFEKRKPHSGQGESQLEERGESKRKITSLAV